MVKFFMVNYGKLLWQVIVKILVNIMVKIPSG